jgi:PAS domain S-box-containing protein
MSNTLTSTRSHRTGRKELSSIRCRRLERVVKKPGSNKSTASRSMAPDANNPFSELGADQLLATTVEFLPDATFVIDQNKRIVAWNRACEVLTGVQKEALLGKGDHAYAEPFFGDRRPILIDLLDAPLSDVEAFHKNVRREGNVLCAETFIPRLRNGLGAHLWGEAAPLFNRQGGRCGAIEVVRDVTEQKRMEKALRESELKYRTLFEAANDAILLMRHDRFLDCNTRTLMMFGCTKQQIVGESPQRFSPERQPDGQFSEEKAQKMTNLALEEGPQLFEWDHCRGDGTPFSAEVSLNRIDLGEEALLLAIVRDITGRKRTEEALRSSEREHRELVMLANSIILRWSPAGMITFINEFGERFFGYPRKEILGRHVVGTIVPESESAASTRTCAATASGFGLTGRTG